MNRNLHRTQFNTILKRMEERYVGSVYMAIRKQYIRAINNIRNHGVSHARNDVSVEVMNKEIGTAVKNIYLSAGVFMANRTLSQLKAIKNTNQKGAVHNDSALSLKYQTFGYNEEWINDILSYFQQYLLEKAVIGVSNTTRERILNVLDEGTRQGWSNDQIIKELSDLVAIRNRARMIVRTETVRAANYGVIQGADKYEYEVVKEWVAVMDNRVRHSHATSDGQKRETDEVFSNGLQFPGDPNGPAKETISCRCSLVIVAKRDSNGRLIPKKQSIPTIPIRQQQVA